MSVAMKGGPLVSSGSPSSLELQSAERLWALTDAAIATTSFKSLDALIEVLSQQLRGWKPSVTS